MIMSCLSTIFCSHVPLHHIQPLSPLYEDTVAGIFPICLALRPCDDANRMFQRITFGLVSGGTTNGGDGIPVYTKGIISVYFQSVAFDSAGELVWPGFSAPLIDPADPDKDLEVQGMHFYAQAKITFPICRVAKGEMHAQFHGTKMNGPSQALVYNCS